MGKRHSGCVVTRVERKSRFLVAVKVDSKEAVTVADATLRVFRKVPKCLRETMTLDNGLVFAQFPQIQVQLGTDVYFADPHAPGIAMARKRNAKTADAVAILHKRYIEGRPDHEALLEAERENAAIGRQVVAMRQEAGLSQRELAESAGTTASSISRQERTDYVGHSLPMLRKIAAVLGRRVEVRFVGSSDSLAGIR